MGSILGSIWVWFRCKMGRFQGDFWRFLSTKRHSRHFQRQKMKIRRQKWQNTSKIKGNRRHKTIQKTALKYVIKLFCRRKNIFMSSRHFQRQKRQKTSTFWYIFDTKTTLFKPKRQKKDRKRHSRQKWK